MNKIICYINDNYIEIAKNKKTKKVTTNSIYNGEIINYKEFINIIKKELSKLLKEQIIIYLNKEITIKDIIFYKYIFEELNNSNIKLYSTNKLLDNNTLIENTNTYILYSNGEFYQIKKEHLDKVIKILKINKIKSLSLNIKPNINNCIVYYYNNINTLFLNKYNLV